MGARQRTMLYINVKYELLGTFPISPPSADENHYKTKGYQIDAFIFKNVALVNTS